MPELKATLESKAANKKRLSSEGRWAEYVEISDALITSQVPLGERKFELTCKFGPGTFENGDMRNWPTLAPDPIIEAERRKRQGLPCIETEVKIEAPDFGEEDEPEEDEVLPDTYDLSKLTGKTCSSEVEMVYVVDNLYENDIDVSLAPSKSAFAYLLWVRKSDKNATEFFKGAYKDFKKKQTEDKKKRLNTLDEDQDLFDTIKRCKTYSKKIREITDFDQNNS